MAKKRLLSLTDNEAFQRYLTKLMRDPKRGWDWFPTWHEDDIQTKFYELRWGDDVHKACRLPSKAEQAERKAQQANGVCFVDTGQRYIDPYALEALLRTYMTNPEKPFEALYKAFCNAERQEKNRRKSSIWEGKYSDQKKSLDIKAAAHVRLSEVAKRNNLSLIDAMSLVADILDDLCSDENGMSLKELKTHSRELRRKNYEKSGTRYGVTQ